MDTKYWLAAFNEWMDADPHSRMGMKVGDVDAYTFSRILTRAQELKKADVEAAKEEASWKPTL